jgi:hypothetical protein
MKEVIKIFTVEGSTYLAHTVHRAYEVAFIVFAVRQNECFLSDFLFLILSTKVLRNVTCACVYSLHLPLRIVCVYVYPRGCVQIS